MNQTSVKAKYEEIKLLFKDEIAKYYAKVI